jgi:hypothetical protein
MRIGVRSDSSIVPAVGNTDGGVKLLMPRRYFKVTPLALAAPDCRIVHCITL